MIDFKSQPDFSFWDDLHEKFNQLSGSNLIQFYEKYFALGPKNRNDDSQNFCRKLSIYFYEYGTTKIPNPDKVKTSED